MTREDSTPGKGAGCLRWGLRILGGLAILLVGLLVAGYVYQIQTTRADFERFPAPGRRVDVGGYSLHIVCQGEGSPTVIVDAGNGDFSLGWGLVQSEAAEFTRICTYDRAGYGWSDPGPEPRTAHQMATELHTLLTNAGVEGPYVLVGHSLGGYTVRMVAHLYPEDVIGMVLVDAGHEEQLTRLPAEYIEINDRQNGYLSVVGVMSRFGVLRLLGRSFGEQALPPHIQRLPADAQEVYVTMISHPSYFRATLRELRALEETFDQIGGVGDLGDLPLVVLTAENTLNSEALESIGLPPGFSVEEIQPVWMELQEELASLSMSSTHLIAEGSGHAIHLDRPDLVVDAIQQVISLSRDATP